MKNKIYYGIITLILCISIISMSTISLYAASYNKRAQVIGSYLSVYAYSYWYNISVQHNNGTITYANDISLYGSNYMDQIASIMLYNMGVQSLQVNHLSSFILPIMQ